MKLVFFKKTFGLVPVTDDCLSVAASCDLGFVDELPVTRAVTSGAAEMDGGCWRVNAVCEVTAVAAAE